MKKINIILALFMVFAVVSCTTEYDVAENFDLEELPGYVAFDAPGNDAVIDDVATDEGAGSVSLTVENPTGTFSDISVNYSLSGSAVFGTDYTIDGASSAGGTMVISPNPTDFGQTDRGDIVITLLTDDVVDGEKMITVTLESASNADGSIAVGRGGKDFLKSANVIIADIDM